MNALFTLTDPGTLMIQVSGTGFCDFQERDEFGDILDPQVFDDTTFPEVSFPVFFDEEPGVLDMAEGGDPEIGNLRDGVKPIGSCDVILPEGGFDETSDPTGSSQTRRVMNSLFAICTGRRGR